MNCLKLLKITWDFLYLPQVESEITFVIREAVLHLIKMIRTTGIQGSDIRPLEKFIEKVYRKQFQKNEGEYFEAYAYRNLNQENLFTQQN